MSDQIIIRGLEIYAHHGVYPEETRLGQKFLVDAVLSVDTRKAGFMDDIHESVDYGGICHFINDYMKKHTRKLLEAVTEHLCEEILLGFPLVQGIELEIKKPWAPIALPIETASVRIERRWHTVYLSVGSNMGDRVSYIKYALECLQAEKRIRNLRVSSLIETAPYGYTDQAPFVNGAIGFQTLYTPYELLDVLHQIEANAGRTREIHWGPRTLDLDILFYDDSILEEADLIVPHADMINRLFVLEPLSELCPGKVHPVSHRTVLQLKQRLENRIKQGKEQ